MRIQPPSDTDAPQYGQRDTLEQGNYFMRHMLAMTGEVLHAKSAIAAELAHRDMEIDRLRKDAERYRWWRAQIQGVRALGSARPAHFGYPSTMALPPVRGDIMRGSVAEHFDHAVDAAMAATPVLGAA